MKIFLIILVSLIGLFIFISIVLGVAIIQFSVRPIYESREHARKNCIKKGYLNGCEDFKREPFEIVLRDGYVIHADVSINNPEKVMVVCHGHCGNRETVLKYARIFFAEGYSIVLYDQRGHGDNKPIKCLMGKNEGPDAVEIIRKVKEMFPNAKKVGAFGVSMGGSFLMMALKEIKDLSFLVIDCSFADVTTVFNDLCHKRFHFPNVLALPFGKLWLKIFHGTKFNELQPKNHIVDNHTPMLFIHGEKDPLIYCHNQEMLINSLPGDCYYENYIFKGALHDNCVNKDPEKYKELVHNFINKVENMNREEASL